eukprot:4401536-Alexandrium_andersonii.AAC.1
MPRDTYEDDPKSGPELPAIVEPAASHALPRPKVVEESLKGFTTEELLREVLRRERARSGLGAALSEPELETSSSGPAVSGTS